MQNSLQCKSQKKDLKGKQESLLIEGEGERNRSKYRRGGRKRPRIDGGRKGVARSRYALRGNSPNDFRKRGARERAKSGAVGLRKSFGGSESKKRALKPSGEKKKTGTSSTKPGKG